MSRSQRQDVAHLIEKRMRPLVIPDARFDLDLSWFIPGFAEAGDAANRLVALDIYQAASRLFVTPDNGLAPLREAAIGDGKTLIMPTYGLRRGFVIIEGANIDAGHAKFASWLDGQTSFGRPVSLEELAAGPKLDLIVTAASAISSAGQRFGMGSQYLDLEYPILAAIGAVDASTPIAAITHDQQYWAQPLSELETDVCADLIFTPTTSLKVTPPAKRPTAIDWALVDETLAKEPYFGACRALDARA